MTQNTDIEHGKDGAAVAPVTDLSTYPDISKIMAGAGGRRRQPMRGFDPDYVDIVDYIVRCTHKIWEEGGMGLLYTHYRHNALVHTAYGKVHSGNNSTA